MTCTICLYCNFCTFLYYASTELNLIDSGIVVLVMSILVIVEELPRVTCFRLFYTDLVSRDVRSEEFTTTEIN